MTDLPPVHIHIQPEPDVDPNQWHAFRFAAARSVADLMETHNLGALEPAKEAEQEPTP